MFGALRPVSQRYPEYLIAVYGKPSPSCATVKMWAKELHSDRERLQDDARFKDH